MARVLIGTVQGAFSDVERWQRQSSRPTWKDARLVAYCAFAWIVCALGARTTLAELAHSPVRSAVTWWFMALSAWLALPVLQLLLPWQTARRLLRAIVSATMLTTGATCLGLLRGIWTITHAPSLHLDYMWEVTFPASALILLGFVELIALLLEPTLKKRAP